MKIWEVVGFEAVNYTNRNGKHVEGYRLHLMHKAEAITGSVVQTVFYSLDNIPYEPIVGDRIELLYEPGFNGSAKLVTIKYAD